MEHAQRQASSKVRNSQVISHLPTSLAQRNQASQLGIGWGAYSVGMSEGH